jgi:syntaxin 1B/2/3
MSGYGGSNPYGAPQQQGGGYAQQPSGGYGNTGAYDTGYTTNSGNYGQQQQPTGQYGGGQQTGTYGAPQQTGSYGGGGYNSGAYSTNPQAPTTQKVSAGGNVLSKPDFLTRVEAVRADIDTLSTQISNIASQHQKLITSTDPYGSQTLEALISSTQVLNTKIRDQIKYLEIDAARSGGDSTKDSQVRNLKTQFKNRLEQYQQEEVGYKKRYQEQIARQYRIVNPGAGEDEVREAVEADWGDEGVFQTAVSAISTLTLIK